MKASVKFRDEQKPLLRAKVPLSILGLPFQSGVVAGESKELSLTLATFFESGPSIRVAYRPNDTWNPFSLVVKTGTASFGSPIDSPMIMTAEFNLVNHHPTFMLHFKPRFGDFSFRKSSQSSTIDKMLASPRDGVFVVEKPPIAEEGLFSEKKNTCLPSTSWAVGSLLSGMEVLARTAVPVRSRGMVSLRWGVRAPAELKSGDYRAAEIAFQKVPFLVMNKIGIEHVDGGDSKGGNGKGLAVEVAGGGALTFPGNMEVAEACFGVKRQLEVLQSENGMLRKAVEELRQEISGGDFKYRGSNRGLTNSERKSQEGDVSEELKKSLTSA